MRDAAVPPDRGTSSTTRPLPGTLTSRSPSGVQAPIRAPGTRAHTRAVHPSGTFSRRGTENALPPSPGGTTRFVHDPAANPGTAAEPGVAGTAAGRADPPQAAVTNPAHATSTRQPERIRPVHHPRVAKSHRGREL